MPAYNRLTEANRIELYALKKAGLSQGAMAIHIGVSPSTISRELSRNTGLRGYQPKQAHRLENARQAHLHNNRISDATWKAIDELI